MTAWPKVALINRCRCNSNSMNASANCAKVYFHRSLAKAGTLLFGITGEDLSLEIECVPHICKSCYNRLDSIAKKMKCLSKQKKCVVS